jgi:hypothetical protein
LNIKAQSPTDLVKRELGATYISMDQIALNTGLSANEVLDALELLERQHGIGRYIDVSSANNVSVRLRQQPDYN